jgi:hypothetical protein
VVVVYVCVWGGGGEECLLEDGSFAARFSRICC